MKITIDGTTPEIAALVLAVQGNNGVDMDAIFDYCVKKFASYYDQIEQNQKPTDDTQ